MISKDQSYADGPVGEHEQFGDGSSMYINGPRVHEFLQEMNREVIQNFDWMTVGEGVGVDTREACLYAGFDRKELNMMFQFEHVEQAKGPLGKWTDQKPDFLRVKEILDRWQTDLEGKAWNSLFVENHDYARSVSTFADDREEYRELSKIQKSEQESDSDVDLRMKQIYQEIRYELEQSGEINRIRLQSDELNRMQGHDKTVVRLKEKIKSLQKNQDIEQYIRKIKTRVCWESLYIFGMERILTGEAKKKFLKLQADFKHIEDLKYEAEKFESIPGVFWRDYYKGKYEKYKLAKSQGKV